jgi:hypothetical protein
LDLRYGGLRARLESMHERLIGYLDPENVAVERIEELEVETELVYPTSGAVMMLGKSFPHSLSSLSLSLWKSSRRLLPLHLARCLDYHRVSRPQYC